MTFEEWISDKEFSQYAELGEWYALQKLCFEAGYSEALAEKQGRSDEQWHYPGKGEYPSLKKLPNGGNYNPLVLVFWYHYDGYEHKAKVYALDRWCPEMKRWEEYDNDNIIAWKYLPEAQKNPYEED